MNPEGRSQPLRGQSDPARSLDQAERLRRMVGAPSDCPGAAFGNRVAGLAGFTAVPVIPAGEARLAGATTDPIATEAPRPRALRLARAIAISSGKGGVGKTNLAVSLAVAFAERGARTALLDADLGLANADVLCGITPRATLEDVVTGERRLDEVMVHAPGGFRLVPGASGVSRLADLGSAQRRLVLEQLLSLERGLEFLLIDTGAGIGANSMTFAAAAHSVLVVCTPEPTSIADAYGAIKTLVARGAAEQLQLVVNMASSAEEARAVHARIDRVARTFLGARIALAAAIPIDPSVPAAVRRREPVLLFAPQSPAAMAIRRLAARLAGESASPRLEEARSGFLARLSGLLRRR
ncbi:MAG: MinD/ParA family protein [Planctomycetota bacterium]